LIILKRNVEYFLKKGPQFEGCKEQAAYASLFKNMKKNKDESNKINKMNLNFLHVSLIISKHFKRCMFA
jgi:hypothetical protein